jgi:hypothetical protein
MTPELGGSRVGPGAPAWPLFSAQVYPSAEQAWLFMSALLIPESTYGDPA